jgi:ribosomal protein L11 methyltransferase
MNYIHCQFEIKEPIFWAEILITYLAEIEFESFEQNENRVDAYIQKPLFEELKVREVLENIQTDVKFVFKEIEDENWNAQWESSFSPIYIDKMCIIRAPFHEKEEGFTQEIIINPQMSFGTGHHQTTYLIMKAMFGIDFENKTVLDMGSGTGILAILAEKLGCKEAVAIDIQDWAYHNTIDNLVLNKCTKITVQEGGAELLTQTNKYEIVLANINRNILVNDMKYYAASMKNEAEIYFSGFYTTDIPIIEREANKNGLTLLETTEKDGWAMVKCQKI